MNLENRAGIISMELGLPNIEGGCYVGRASGSANRESMPLFPIRWSEISTGNDIDSYNNCVYDVIKVTEVCVPYRLRKRRYRLFQLCFQLGSTA